MKNNITYQGLDSYFADIFKSASLTENYSSSSIQKSLTLVTNDPIDNESSLLYMYWLSA